MGDINQGQLLTPSIRLVRPFGKGGMGSVWLADHLALKTQVVVKFMATELATNPDAVSRFAREAAAAAQVKSPHVVQMLDHGLSETGVPYIVMELLEGRELSKHLDERGTLSPAEVSAIVSQLCKALRRAHERHIVHRDIKPDNIFLCDVGGNDLFVKLLDFGVAKLAIGHELTGEIGTRTGAMVGTPYYMSPEQLVGAKDLDLRTDLWSVGVVAYQALTRELPFTAETIAGLAVAIHSGPTPMPSAVRPDLPAGIDAWFARVCARDPKARFGSAMEMADALEAVVRGVPLPALVGAAAVPTSPASDPSIPGSAAGAVTSPVTGSTVGTFGSTMQPTAQPSRRRGRAAIAAATGVVAIGATLALAIPRGSPTPSGAAMASSTSGTAPSASALPTAPVTQATGATPSPSAPLSTAGVAVPSTGAPSALKVSQRTPPAAAVRAAASSTSSSGARPPTAAQGAPVVPAPPPERRPAAAASKDFDTQ